MCNLATVCNCLTNQYSYRSKITHNRRRIRIDIYRRYTIQLRNCLNIIARLRSKTLVLIAEGATVVVPCSMTVVSAFTITLASGDIARNPVNTIADSLVILKQQMNHLLF